MNRVQSKGISLVELLIVVAIAAIIIGVLSFFIGRILSSYREQREQSLITEDARVQVQRIAGAIRNAHSVKPPDEEDERFWIEKADPYEIVVYSNVMGGEYADRVERVRYYIEGTDLIRGVIIPNPGGNYPTGEGEIESKTTLAKSIRNLEEEIPLFTYFKAGGDGAFWNPENDDLESIRRVGINLVVNVNPNQKPDASHVYTKVTPRRWKAGFDVEQNLEPVRVTLPDTSEGPPEGGYMAELAWIEISESKDIAMATLNSGRLRTFNENFDVMAFQTTMRFNIMIGGEVEPFYMTVGDLISANCLNQELSFMLEFCLEQEVDNDAGQIVTFQPIITYTDFESDPAVMDYVREIDNAPPPDPEPTIDIKADGSDGPVTVMKNDTVTISWTVEDADWCEATGGSDGWEGSLAPENGSWESDPLAVGSHTYTITCGNAEGDTQDSVTVDVEDPCAIKHPTIFGHWRMAEGSGIYTWDSITGAQGSFGSSSQINWFPNSAPLVTCPSDWALEFTGSYISTHAPAYISKNVNQPFTVSIWVRDYDTLGGGHRGILTLATTGSNAPFTPFHLNFTNRETLWIGSFGANQTWMRARASVSLAFDTWTHIAVTYNGNDPKEVNNFRLYVNGSLRSLSEHDFIGGGDYSNLTRIGGYPTGPLHNWHGALDDLRIYNQELTASEVLTLRNGQEID